jgi:tetratricopeptide (TPR) repeat protein
MEYQIALLAPRQLTPEQESQKRKLIEAGNAAFDDDNYELALECFHRASVLDPSDAATWNLLGLTYANLELPWEAWRSFKLALHASPQSIESLWYAGEFLYTMQDYALARVLLLRYAELELDETKRGEALVLVGEINQILPPPPEEHGEGEEPAMVDLDEEGLPVDPQAGPAAGAAELEGESLAEDEEDADIDEEAEPPFIASLVLQLTAMGTKCSQCATMLPSDAPYCYNCYSPCFYEDR